MKKIKYIIFGWASGVAGGQLFTDNKCKALITNDIDTYIFYGENSEILLDNIKKVKTKYCYFLNHIPSDFSKRKIRTIIKSMIDFIGNDYDEIFVESNDEQYSFWAELLSKELKCYHYLYAVEGFFNHLYKDRDYLFFKLDRKELAGAEKMSIPNLLNGEINSDDKRNKYFNAICTNSVSDITTIFDSAPDNYDIKIGYIGRETKPCFAFILRDIFAFANNHLEKKIICMCIGSVKSKDIDTLLVEKPANLEICFTGRMFPISRRIIKKLDIAIGTSQSSDIAAIEGIKTIRFLDDNDYPLGVIGYDFIDLNSYERVYMKSLNDLLSDILFNDYCSNYKYYDLYKDYSEEAIMESLFKDTLEMMKNNNDYNYFDTYKIHRKGIRGIFEKAMSIKCLYSKSDN